MKLHLIPIAVLFVVQSLIVVPFGLASQTPKNGATTLDATDSGWPRTIVGEGTTLLFYQPQVSKWQDNTIEAYAAVAVQDGGGRSEIYGVVYFTARIEVDKVNRLVTLQDFKITRADFPSAPDKAAEHANVLQQAQANKVKTISYDRFLANLRIVEAEGKGGGYEVNNQPPRIIFSTKPGILVPIDGQPVPRPLEEAGFQRVINTRALIVLDQGRNTYYLYLMNGWVKASTPEGPWTFADDVPSGVKKAKDKLSSNDQVDLLSDQAESGEKQESLKDRVKDGTFPQIYVSTVPAELLICEGDPQFTPIPDTNLLYVSNSDDDIFKSTADQDYYVLISGRWFRAASLDGPWEYVAATNLPSDFAKIPPDHQKASVLASTPGTQAADEARIADQVPQTATITRNEAQLTVDYDGEPRFNRIEGTSLNYAVNTSTPVIEVRPGLFCGVDDGVWFQAASPLGPWAVATSVPTAIYSIPPRCPLHYVTYVRVYGYTNDVVYCGFTPGYYGTVLTTDGLIVYGTGWYYPPYIGSYWFGWPWTYGWGAGFAWSPWWGWSFDFGIGYFYPFWRPWWGPLGWGWRWHRWGPRWGWGRFGGVAAVNIYGRWGRGAFVRTRAAWASPHAGDTTRHRFGRTGITPPTVRTGPGVRSRPGNPNPPPRRPEIRQPRTEKPGARQPAKPVPPIQRPVKPGRPAPRQPAPVRPAPPMPARPSPRHRNEVFAGSDGNIYRYDQNNGGWQQRNGRTWETPGRAFDQRSLDQTRQMRQQGNQRWDNFPGRSPGSSGHASRPSSPAPRPSGGARAGGGGARGGARKH